VYKYTQQKLLCIFTGAFLFPSINLIDLNIAFHQPKAILSELTTSGDSVLD